MQYADAIQTTVDPMVMNRPSAWLNWLENENQAAVERANRFRRPSHELELAMMARPISTRNAYEWLGLLLGTIPPALIFVQIFGYGLSASPRWGNGIGAGLFFLCLMMNLVCGLMGFLMGRALSRAAFIAERSTWSQMIIVLAMLGIAWGITTGSLGGLFFFGIGALFGPVFAVPVGVVAFLVFGTLHRLLERGGIIELRHFLPVAIGITAVISMLIAVR